MLAEEPPLGIGPEPRELGIDRAEIRRRNLIGPDEFPYDVGVTFQDGGPTVYDSGDYPRGLGLLLEAIGYDEFERRPGLGLGIACYVEGSGIGPYEGAAVNVLGDGTVTVATGLASQGQGHATMLAQIAADELGVEIDAVRVTTGDTRRIGYGVGPAPVIEAIHKVRRAFDVTTPAQEAALASLDAPEELARRRAVNRESMALLQTVLREAGFSPVGPAAGNFLFVDVGTDAAELDQALLRRGVIVRPMGSFGAPTALRVTAGTKDEIAYLAEQLRDVFSKP